LWKSTTRTGLLQAAQFGSENYFAAGSPIRQRELVRCRLPNSAMKTVSLQAASSAAKTVSLLAP